VLDSFDRMMSEQTVDLSIVTSLFGSAPHLEEFHARCARAAASLTASYEIVMVNDASTDDSLRLALDIHRRDPRVRVIDLSRNFGHHKALMTGLSYARGNLVFLIDSDLEEDPGWLPEFRKALAATGADVVYGVQQNRKGGWFERSTGELFFRVFNRMLTQRIPANVVTARLMTRRYVRALVAHRDQEVFLAGLWMTTGFDQRAVVVDKQSRSRSTYSPLRRLSVLVNALTSFSNRPLIYIFQLGVAVVLLSIVAAIVLMYRRLTGAVGVPGWASIMVSIWFLGGLMIFCIGVIGIYLAKVFTETKDRPYTIVRAEYGSDTDVAP
jgi:putative glycosyltransferase